MLNIGNRENWPVFKDFLFNEGFSMVKLVQQATKDCAAYKVNDFLTWDVSKGPNVLQETNIDFPACETTIWAHFYFWPHEMWVYKGERDISNL